MQTRKSNNHKSKNLNSIYVLLLGMLLASCGSNKLVEDYQALTDNEWRANDIRSFRFNIEDPNVSYDLYFTVKNGLDYPFHNLYVDYKLYAIEDDADALITTDLEECLLFDVKTGVPAGDGNSGWYNHEFLMLENHRFAKAGTYEIRFQQYMRREVLTAVASVGFGLVTYTPKP